MSNDTKVITGKQVAEFMHKFSTEELVTMSYGIRDSIRDAAMQFEDTISQLRNTYPELFVILGIEVNLTVKDHLQGTYVEIGLSTSAEAH